MSKEFGTECPYCGSSNIGDSGKEIKCFDCGMGKYKDGKHKQ
jgi:DNA-directed RNA polymerase subunit RPC12/RpoP